MKSRTENNRCDFFIGRGKNELLLQMLCLFTGMLKTSLLSHQNVEIWTPLNDVLVLFFELKQFEH